MKKVKTNALRILDSKKIDYEVKEYEYDEEHLSGAHVLNQVDLKESEIYKTLVLKSKDEYLVCCIPVLKQINLKKLAKETGHKSVEMIPMKDLLNVTGYIRGGCSPIGMKKKFKTYIQIDIIDEERVAISAGKRGVQVVLKPDDLIECVEATLVDVIQ